MSETPVLDLLARMNLDSVEQSALDPGSLMLVRLAALVATDAPPFSYVTNLGLAADAGLEVEHVQEVLIAVAPIVGTARVMSAAGNIARALGVAVAVVEAEIEASLGGDA
ncbi:MAG: carboxymuconolactone decarboxylase family protein [Miltoncostaeaceae bacterium]